MPLPPAPAPFAPMDPRPEFGPVTWRWWEALFVFIAGLFTAGLLFVVVAPLFSETSGMLVVGILGEFVPLAFLVGWLQLAHKGWRASVGFPAKGRWPLEIGAGVLGGLAVYFVGAIVVGTILTLVFQAVSGGEVDTPDQLPLNMNDVQVFLAAMLAIVAAPVTEEFFFRACFFRSIRGRHPYWVAGAWSSALFAIVHFSTDGAGPLGGWLLVTTMFFVGFGFSYVYERRRNIASAMVAHATFNVLGFLAILFLR